MVASVGARVEPEAEEFTRLYERSYRPLEKYIRQRVSDSELSHDLAAETFARALEKQRDGTAITFGWLIVTARNLIGNEYQRRERERSRIERIAIEQLTAGQGQDDAEGGEVRAAMSQLRPTDALVLQLTYWDGLTAAEAAAVVGCSTAALWVRLTRARSAMRKLLAEQSVENSPPGLDTRSGVEAASDG